MKPNERKEMQSSKTHLVPDSLIKTESNASKSKRWQASALKPRGPLKKEDREKETDNGKGLQMGERDECTR